MPTAIYLLVHSPYPEVSGGSRRAANIIEVLSDRFEMTVLAADDTSSSNAGWATSASRLLKRRRSRLALAVDLLEGLIRGRHIVLQRSIRAGVLKAFAGELAQRRPALVVLGRPFVGPFLDAALDSGAFVVVDADESLPKVAWRLARSSYSPIRHRLRALIEAIFVLGRMERGSYPRAAEVFVSSEPERAILVKFLEPRRVRVVPNVIQVDDVPIEPGPVTALAFVGSYLYPPNEAAALELISSIMPITRTLGGPRRLVLIGPSPSAALQAAAANDPEVEILGEVPDVRGPLRTAGVLVAPIRAGGGTRMKILEAMAAGVPVVTTKVGAEGLDLAPERTFLLAETARDFAEQVSRLAANEVLREGLVRTARQHVAERNSMSVLRRSLGQTADSIKAPLAESG